MDNQQEQVLDSSREQKQQDNVVHCTGPLYMQNDFAFIRRIARIS